MLNRSLHSAKLRRAVIDAHTRYRSHRIACRSRLVVVGGRTALRCVALRVDYSYSTMIGRLHQYRS